MANLATTLFKVCGTRKAASDLWTTLQTLGVNDKNIWLGDLAEHYGIDYKEKHIMVRGHIYWAEYEEDEENDMYVVSLETETAWSEPNEIFEEISALLWYDLQINYRVIECGCDLFHVHRESAFDFFPEECCVSSYGAPFDEACEDVYETVGDAIKVWCEKMNVSQDGRTEEEMMDFINDYEYEDDDTYFYIHPFTFD